MSVEYVSTLGTYRPWSQRTSTVTINLLSSVEIANMDIDGTGRMWIAYDGSTQIYVSWSDAPYQNWSSPITVATGLSTDDIGAIIALPGKMGIFGQTRTPKNLDLKRILMELIPPPGPVMRYQQPSRLLILEMVWQMII